MTSPRLAVAATALALALAFALAAAGWGASPPRTLATADGPIAAFAQDGRFLAWAAREPRTGCVSVVRLHDLRRQRTWSLTRPGSAGCRMTAHVAQLAVAATGAQARVLWTRYETGNNVYHWLHAGSTAALRERAIGLLTESTADELRVAVAGDGPFLGFGWAHAGETDCPDDCPYVIRDGGLSRLGRDLRGSPVAAVPPAALAEAGGGFLAVLSRGRRGAATTPRPDLREVELRHVSTLALVARVQAPASVLALAVSAERLAILTRGAIDVYDTDGSHIARHAVPRTTAPELTAGGTRVVYRVGRSVRLAGRSQPLLLTAADPIGLSLEGSRLAWAENVRGRGRVRTLTVR